MRLLIDSCVSKFAVNDLRRNGHDLIWIPEEGTDPGDTEILNRAYQEDRILVTADKDFGDLVFVFQKPHPAIIRLVNLQAKEQGPIILNVLEKYEPYLGKLPILTVNKNRVRVKYPNKSGDHP